jgi:phosphohistidine phosphatase
MKLLTIVRHAKAVPGTANQPDFDRPLAEKGYKQIGRVAPAIRACPLAPDRIVSSPALRAAHTAERLAEAIGFAGEIAFEPHIYEAAPLTLLEILRQQPAPAQHVALVGHNPGLEMLVSGLCSGDDARLNVHLTTAGVAHIELEIAHWRQARWGAGILRLLLAPRYVKKY